jgi:CO/xanthine dehydrogenase Mo-binding subunit/CO/xanthine dehydrogenase FAD-binding subunit
MNTTTRIEPGARAQEPEASGYTTVLGHRVPRVDGAAKVTGAAVYGDDIKLPGMLYGVCRYTDIAAGKIVSIDTSDADKVEGVVRIATYKDITGNPVVGVIVKDYLPIVKDEIVFHGDVLAVVAASTFEAACLAAELIKVEYEPYQPITTIEEAIKPGARRIHAHAENNRINHHHTAKGDIDAGFAASAHILERDYEVGFQEHAYIEPETITAYIDPTERTLVITGSVQNPHRVRGFVSGFLGMAQSKINIKRAVMGGSFGGKDDVIDHLSCRAGLMATLTGRPVKFTYTREQSIRESCKRHPYKMKYKVGLDDSGRILAIKVDILADGGGYAASTPFVTWRSVIQAAGPYNIANVRVDTTGIYTNNSYTSAMRGFGSPQIVYANESLMDEIARHFNMSPVEIRRINMLRQDDQSITGQAFTQHVVSTGEVLNLAVTQAKFEEKREQCQRRNAEGGTIKYGIGLALSYRGCSMGAEGVDTGTALVQVNHDGSISVSTSVAENGQGLQTTMSLIAAESFGVTLKNVVFSEPPTSVIADGGPTVASRATLMGGQAVVDAAEKIKARIVGVIGDSIKVKSLAETEWRDGKIFNKAQPEHNIPFVQAVNTTKWASVNLADYGWFAAPDIHWDEEKGNGSPYFTWVYGCNVAEVAVDTSTGKVTMQRVTAVHDVGKVINPVGFEGQVCGGIAQGCGYAVLEDFNIEHGIVKSENFDSYLLPTIKDIPPIDAYAVENHDPQGPFGAKSIGEPATELAAAAINNAVNFALGTAFNKLPLTLEQVFLGYNLKKPVRQSEKILCKHQVSSDVAKQVLRLNNISIRTPSSLEEALTMLAEANVTAVAGGTDVVVQGRMKSTAQNLVNIAKLPELCHIEERDGSVVIGGGVWFNKLTEHPLVQARYPLLFQACHSVGSHQIRNRATLGGNMVNAAPCADSVPPLIAYGADVVLQSAVGKRRMPVADFITNGYETKLQKGELLVEVILPAPPADMVQNYDQLGRRNALNITRLSLTSLLAFDGDGKIRFCRLVDGALLSKPQRLAAVEQVLLGKALNDATVAEALTVLGKLIEDAIGGRWSAEYKKPVYLNIFRDQMNKVRAQIGP